jgi:predicted extracellular nuclease
MRLSRRLTRLACAALLSFAALPAFAQVVISQVYGGGGNTGATYRNDFIEVFNAGSGAVDLTGWSVQYASASGTSWSVTPLSGSLQPGQYLLVQQAAGANTLATPLPSPDITGTINMSGTAGKVALRNTTAVPPALTACPTAVDFVGFGATNCPNPTATLSNTTAALRKGDGCTNTGSPTADFSTGPAAPRNRGTALNPCGVVLPTDPTVTATATPSVVEPGESLLLRATVTPGANPASTGLVVLANLSPIGGADGTPLHDDGTHGDLVAGDKVFSLATSVAPGTAPGSKLIGIGVGDDQLRSGSASVTVSVIQLLAIHDVQGNGVGTPYASQSVAVEGIVTARKTNGFFLQSADADVDADPATSEALFVFTGSPVPAAAAVGNRVRALGTAVEFTTSSNPHQLSITELTGATVSLLATGQALPAPVSLTAEFASADSAITALERYEGMRVSIASLRVVAPVAAFVTETTAASPSNGVFFGVLAGVDRPYREPGISALDATPIPAGISPPVFDTNPERIRVQSTGQAGAVALGADVGDVIDGLVGVLDYGFGTYSLLPDPGIALSVVPGATPTAVSAGKPSEITIGGFNLQRFFDEFNAPGIGEPVLQAATVAARLKKTANAICGYVRAPDILGVVEVENLAILQRLADGINAGDTQEPGSCARNPQYVAHLAEGNDVGGIDVGFLLSTAEVAPGKPRIEVLSLEQVGKDTLFTNPNGSTDLLNDRPSYVLRARVNAANGAHSDITVIANHLRSLIDVNSIDPGSDGWATAGARVRAKRAAQAAFLAGVIHARQLANPDEKIVLLGDFNAFEFNDGLTDMMGVITGREAGPTEVLDYVDSPITTPLTNMAELSPVADRYSFTFDGSAQSLDHMVVNQALLDATAGVRAEHARINADFGEDNYGDFTVPVRVSDHDPVVLYLDEAAFSTADLAATVQAANGAIVIGQQASFGIGVANGGPDAAAPVVLQLNLDRAVAGLSVQAPAGWTCAAPVVTAASTGVRCSTAALAAGATASFVASLPTDREFGGSALTLSAAVSSPMTDLAPANNSGSDSLQVTASADLAALVIGPKGPISSKKPASFAIGIANAGPHDAREAVLVIHVNGPKQVVTGLSAGGLACANATDTPTASTWHCSGGAWYVAGRVNGLLVTVNPAYSSGSVLSVGAGFSSGTTDPNPGNNASAAAVKVNGPTITLH